MKTPHSYVQSTINRGDFPALIRLLNAYSSTMSKPDELRAFEIRSFSDIFIFVLICELKKAQVSPGSNRATLDAFLTVWEQCGYFGIDRRAPELMEDAAGKE